MINHQEGRAHDDAGGRGAPHTGAVQAEGHQPNGLANLSAVPQATIKSILNGESRNPGTVTVKKLCDAFEITLGEFFSTPEFDRLEQEIK